MSAKHSSLATTGKAKMQILVTVYMLDMQFKNASIPNITNIIIDTNTVTGEFPNVGDIIRDTLSNKFYHIWNRHFGRIEDNPEQCENNLEVTFYVHSKPKDYKPS